MKKIIYTLLFGAAINVSAFAQAILPTSWDFSTTQTPGPYPAGWTPSGTAFYTTSGNPGIACKFAVTGNTLVINFTTPPGNLTYDIKANTANSAAYTSVFLVEESANGTSWTTLHSHTALSITAFTSFTDTPLSTSRYIRFNLSVKASGNIALDNVAIAAAAAGPAQQINVKQGSAVVLTGGIFSVSSPVGTMTPTTFTIQNVGTVNALNISAAALTGAAAGDFSVTTATPFSVASNSSSSLIVDFTPSAIGTRNAVLTITNDDPNNGSFIINLNGIGGSYATEPTAQATSMTFTAIKSYTVTGHFTGTSPSPDGYLVLRKTGSAISDVPADGTIYGAGDVIGTSKVVYSSTASAFYLKEVIANTSYYFAVFAYNGTGIYRNYLTAAPLTGNVTSAGSMQPAGYYTGVSSAASTFVTDLHNKINPHTIQFYSSYGPLMVSAFYARDTAAGQRVLTCVYSGENKVYTEPFDWTNVGYSREHTFCHSWMPTTNDPAFQNRPEYNDYHMLTPTNQNQVNAPRSNNPLGEVVGTPISTYLGDKIGLDANGNKVFEPRDSDKGDAARCMLYQCICYTGVAYTGPVNTDATYGGSWSLPSRISNAIPYGQDQNVLKKWNYQDPPDNFEIARNDYVDSLQGNRNPFIDSAQFICYIDFTTMTKIAGPHLPCNTEVLGVTENPKNNNAFMLSPNPNNGNFVLNYTSSKEEKVSLKLVDIAGRTVYSSELLMNSGSHPIELSMPNLSKGVYIFELTSPKMKQTQKMVIE